MEYIYGLDLSLASYGVAICDENYNVIKIGTIKTKSTRNKIENRLNTIWTKLSELKEKYPPKITILERGFTKFNTATQQLYRVHGITNLCFNGIEQIYVSPRTLKKAICNNSTANKKDMLRKIRLIYNNTIIGNDDEADALALIHYYKHFIERKIIDET